MRAKLREKMAEATKTRDRSAHYAIFQCKKCTGQTKIAYDQLVPAVMVCLLCGGKVMPKVVMP